jgi:hypothetical protein
MTTLIEIGSIETLTLISTGAIEAPLVASASAGAVAVLKIGGALVLVAAAALLAGRLVRVLDNVAEEKLTATEA